MVHHFANDEQCWNSAGRRRALATPKACLADCDGFGRADLAAVPPARPACGPLRLQFSAGRRRIPPGAL